MSLAAVLLAGGESRRMGHDKATLSFRGKSLWHVQLQVLRGLQPNEIFVSARRDPDWRPQDVKFVQDSPPSRGPLSGLAAALDRMRSSHLIALGTDMPFMTVEFLQELCRRIEPRCGVLPMIRNRAEPLAAVYPVEAKRDMAKALSSCDFSLQAITKKLISARILKVFNVSEAEELFFRNVNVPSDLRRFA